MPAWKSAWGQIREHLGGVDGKKLPGCLRDACVWLHMGTGAGGHLQVYGRIRKAVAIRDSTSGLFSSAAVFSKMNTRGRFTRNRSRACSNRERDSSRLAGVLSRCNPEYSLHGKPQ